MVGSDEFDSVEVDDMPSVIKPIPPMEKNTRTSYIKPLSDMITDVSKEQELQAENF